MKITIRTNPEIIIEVDQDKTSAVLPITTGLHVPPIAPAREAKPDPAPEPKLGATKRGTGKIPSLLQLQSTRTQETHLPKR